MSSQAGSRYRPTDMKEWMFGFSASRQESEGGEGVAGSTGAGVGVGGKKADETKDWKIEIFAKYQLEHAYRLHRQRAKNSRSKLGPVPAERHGDAWKSALSDFAHVGASVSWMSPRLCYVSKPKYMPTPGVS